jgi:hypothetical protein
MSDSDVLSILSAERYWILPEETIELPLSETTYPSWTKAQVSDSFSCCFPFAQEIFDVKSGLQICVLAVAKNAKAIDETEGILSYLEHELQERDLEPVDLVKRAWKSSEHDDSQPST